MMSLIKAAVAVYIISVCSGALHLFAQTPGQKEALVHAIDSILKSQVNKSKIPGAVIEVKIADDVIMQQAYGYAQKYDDNHYLLARPDSMTTGTLFDIASLTKVVGTATSIMLLAIAAWCIWMTRSV